MILFGLVLTLTEGSGMKTQLTTLTSILLLLALGGGNLRALENQEPKSAAGDGPTVKEDVVYGRVHGAALVADVAVPSGDGPFPIIISVHGGRWVGGSKTDPSTIKVAQWAK